VRVVNSISDTSECVPVSLDIRVDWRDLIQQRTETVYQFAYLSYRWKTNETNGCDTRPRNIEPETASASSSATGGDELTPELCKLCLQLTQVIARGLVCTSLSNQEAEVSRTATNSFGLIGRVNLRVHNHEDWNSLLAYDNDHMRCISISITVINNESTISSSISWITISKVNATSIPHTYFDLLYCRHFGQFLFL
jgi:hypothetical protein